MMKRIYSILVTALVVSGCSQQYEAGELAGLWFNEEEKCRLQLNTDSTFTAFGLPLDVENEYYIERKQSYSYSGHGKWKYADEEIRLDFSAQEYYCINVHSSEKLSVKLLDESGGDFIFLYRR